jgi:hypothetical protein
MIDDGVGFGLVPWQPTLEQYIGRHIFGTVMPGGELDWSFARSRGPLQASRGVNYFTLKGSQLAYGVV